MENVEVSVTSDREPTDWSEIDWFTPFSSTRVTMQPRYYATITSEPAVAMLYFYYNTNQRVYHKQHNSTGTGSGNYITTECGHPRKQPDQAYFTGNTGYSVDCRVFHRLVEMDYNDLYTSGTSCRQMGKVTNVCRL